MLHTKFRGNLSTVSGDFLKSFTTYGRGGHLGHVTQILRTHFRGSTQNLALISQAVWEKRCLNIVNGRRSYVRWTDARAFVYYKLTW